MLQTDLAIANKIHSTLATDLDVGPGFWLNATSATPTFRVGIPGGNRVRWDGTNVEVISANLSITNAGVFMTPGTHNTYDATRAFGWTAPNGELGIYGYDSGSSNRSLVLKSRWSGGDFRPTSVQLHAQYVGPGNSATASVSAGASNGAGSVDLATTQSGGVWNGNINIFGIPSFYGASSGVAGVGGPVGFIHVKVNGTDYRIPVHAPPP